MTPEFLTLILWVPFILAFLTFAIPYCSKGFKKGLWHALISTVATVVAAVGAFFGAKFLAPLCLSKVTGLLPEFSFEELGSMGHFLPAVIEGLITGFVSLILFSVLLLILTLVCKLLLSLIPVPKGKGLLRIFGMALRLIDAAALTVLLLLPLYGTIAAYGPSLSAVLEYAQVADEPVPDPEIESYLHSATEHPLVKLAGTKPCAAIYNGLAAVKTDSGVINVPEMMQSVSQATKLLDVMANGEFSASDLEVFADLSKDVVSQDWFYSAFASASESIKPLIEELGEDAPTYLTALNDLTALPREEFTQCCEGILDWVSFASDKGLFQVMEDGTLDGEWITNSELVQKTLEIQETMPEDFPFFRIVLQFFRDYMEETAEN